MSDSTADYLNFCFSVPAVLENDRLQLVPLVAEKHAVPFYENILLYPNLLQYLPCGPFESVEDLTTGFLEKFNGSDPAHILFAIYDKTRPSTAYGATHEFAGIVGMINSSAEHLQTEIGYIVVLPPFHRTHVASNVVGLLLHFCLGPPTQGGLGLRRVVWQANSLNAPSIRAAGRMGFRHEGILRWDRVVPPGTQKIGISRVGKDGEERIARHIAILGLCWEEWELEGVREMVDKIMARES
ncbi:acyl-CoA N-acyltransferase [Infundibulicybe gibba]|nr:acyl-CoA N-acyltransferase [Infundibulicybe gibba]